MGWRPEDLEAVVKSPRNVAYVEDITRKLEQGDLKLRVSPGLRHNKKIIFRFSCVFMFDGCDQRVDGLFFRLDNHWIG